MSKRIYVGNLPFSATDDEVRELIGDAVAVTDVRVKRSDKAQLAAAAIDLDNDDSAAAIKALHGATLGGNKLVAVTDRSILVNHEEIWWP